MGCNCICTVNKAFRGKAHTGASTEVAEKAAASHEVYRVPGQGSWALGVLARGWGWAEP